jgi:hypothetical protein
VRSVLKYAAINLFLKGSFCMKKSTALLFASGTVLLYVCTGYFLSSHKLSLAGIAFGASLLVTGLGFMVKAKANR